MRSRCWLANLEERLAKFGLSLHEDKTRLIEFGRLPALTRQQRRERRPETFAFLGFTHYCGWTRDGRFIVKQKTQGKRLTRKLKALRQNAWRHMHAPVADQHCWLSSVLRGHYGYYGVPHNWRAMNGFHQEVRRIWITCLRRRSQKGRRMTWDQFQALTERFPLPQPRIASPFFGNGRTRPCEQPDRRLGEAEAHCLHYTHAPGAATPHSETAGGLRAMEPSFPSISHLPAGEQ